MTFGNILKKFVSRCSEIYLYEIFLKIAPKYQGYVDWARIIFWCYPKHLILPQLSLFFKNKDKLSKASCETYISYIPPLREGIGGQLSRYSTTLILADLYDIKYVHQPFTENFQTPGLDWDKFLGFHKKSDSLRSLLNIKKVETYLLPRFDLRYLKKMQLLLLSNIISLRKRLNVDTLFLVTSYSFYPNDEYVNWSKILNKMKASYTANKKPLFLEKPSKSKKINVSVLVRRGEILHFLKKGHPQGFWRWLDIGWYESVIKKLTLIYGSKLSICIFSDSEDESEFEKLLRPSNVQLYLHKDSKYQPFVAFDTMSKSDIVVCGLSGFSYFPASFSDGAKIVPPSKVKVNYFPSDKVEEGWFSSDKDGSFDTVRLKTYLKPLLKKRGLIT